MHISCFVWNGSEKLGSKWFKTRGLKKQKCDFFFPFPGVLKWNAVIGARTNATACIIAARDISWVLFFILTVAVVVFVVVVAGLGILLERSWNVVTPRKCSCNYLWLEQKSLKK